MLALSLAAADPQAAPTAQSFQLPSWLSGGAPSDPDTTIVLAPPAPPSLMAPPRPRDLTRVETTWRPFLGFVGNSWGTIGEMRIEHHFAAPFMIGAELSPVADRVVRGRGRGGHARSRDRGVRDRLPSLGLGVGARLQRYGSSGLSLAPSLRLGSMDGLNLELTYTHTIAPNKYSGKMTTGFSNVLAKIAGAGARAGWPCSWIRASAWTPGRSRRWACAIGCSAMGAAAAGSSAADSAWR